MEENGKIEVTALSRKERWWTRLALLAFVAMGLLATLLRVTEGQPNRSSIWSTLALTAVTAEVALIGLAVRSHAGKRDFAITMAVLLGIGLFGLLLALMFAVGMGMRFNTS